jgi:hypothetical protein
MNVANFGPDSVDPFQHIIEKSPTIEVIIMERWFSRRALVKTIALGTAGTALASRRVFGGEPQKLDVRDPAAMAVGYVEDANQVDTKKYPTFVKGANCENCLQLQGTAGSHFRPCSIFSGKLVAINGWCTKWTAEM